MYRKSTSYENCVYLSTLSNLSSLYEEEQLNTVNNLTSKLHHNETPVYHHFNGNKNNLNNASQATNGGNFNQMPIDHKIDNNENKLTNSSRINKGHPLLKTDAASDGSNSNTLIDSDVSNSSNSFASS